MRVIRYGEPFIGAVHAL